MRYGEHCEKKLLVPKKDAQDKMKMIQDANTILEKVNEPKIQLQNYLRSQLVNPTTTLFEKKSKIDQNKKL